MSDKTEYEQKRNDLIDNWKLRGSQVLTLNPLVCELEALALAEGERRQQEKDKSWFAGFGNVGIAEYEKRVKAQAKKEYAEGEAERLTAIHGHGFQLGVEEGKRLERERIEGIIAEMETRKVPVGERQFYIYDKDTLSELKKAIAEKE